MSKDFPDVAKIFEILGDTQITSLTYLFTDDDCSELVATDDEGFQYTINSKWIRGKKK